MKVDLDIRAARHVFFYLLSIMSVWVGLDHSPKMLHVFNFSLLGYSVMMLISLVKLSLDYHRGDISNLTGKPMSTLEFSRDVSLKLLCVSACVLSFFIF